MKLVIASRSPKLSPFDVTIEDIIDRSVKHDDIYYYGSSSRYFKELDAKIVYKTGIYRIDDSGVATRKWNICPTLKANMGTYPDRVPIIRDDFGIRKLSLMECLVFQGYPKSYTFKVFLLKVHICNAETQFAFLLQQQSQEHYDYNFLFKIFGGYYEI